jgi:hypothetical protein
MSRIFASFGIAKGFTAVSILTVVSAPALAQLRWDLSTAPVQYLQYDLPYYKLALGSFPKDQDSRPKPRVAVGRYGACTTTRSRTRHRCLGLRPFRTLGMT